MDTSEARIETPEQSDPEGESFEDAQEVKKTTPAMSRQRSSTSTRSLTERSSSATSRQSLNGRPQSSASNLSNQTPIVSPTGPPRSVPADAPRSVPAEESTEPPTPREPKLVEPAAQAEPISEEKEETEEVALSPMETVAEEAHTLKKSEEPSKRASAAFQEVHLDGTQQAETLEATEPRGRQLSVEVPVSPHSNPSSTSHSRSTSRLGSAIDKAPGLVSTSTFGLGSWGGKPSSNNSGAPPMTKKMSGPWGWLSRKKTAQDNPSPPQSAPRKDTVVSTGSGGSNPDLTLHKIDKERDASLPAKDQLKERFKLARMKGEAGVDVDQLTSTTRSSMTSAADSENRPASDTGLGIQTSAPIINGSEVVESPQAEPRRGHKARARSMAQTVNTDPQLAPGTVSGIAHGPSTMHDPQAPVDWDLWQSVVYEGPSAVAKTSAADLTREIASGIPNPIRGVVWQVLAQSKSEELEAVYRELILRGTDKEIAPSPNPNSSNPPLSAKSLTSNDTTKESVASSASSVKSETETPATTNGMTSPVTGPNADGDANAAKMQAAVAVERSKKSKEDVKKLEKTIRKDLGARSNYSKYFAAKEMQEDLFNVCKAYALYDETVGYAQGMNFIVMPLLFNMPAEEAFCLLVRLMNHYKLRDTFTPEMPGLHRQLYQFERLLEDTEPKLCHHLNRRGISPSLYATQWFITLFAYKFPLQLVLRIYDLVLSEGLESAVLKFGVALMQKNAEKLLELQDMAALKTYLNEKLFDAYIDSAPSSHSVLEHGFFGNSGGSEKDVYRADLLVQDACTISALPETLKTYGEEYDSKTKAEKERQVELDDLRANTASQAAKIRSLEQRCEKSDAEHVQITQEMIHSRMQSEELRAAITDSQKEVEGLKKTIAAQPGEVEQKLKDEMDRIMARNTEVQNQNRMLEEQMAEMEKALVETKMKFAEVNGDYETLKQKWSDLRRALGD